jgi:predicted DNA-binding transcriptional regulator AlpA
MPADPSRESLTVDAAGAARLVGISPSHFFALIRTGRFGPEPIRLGRCRRYRVAELTAWVESGCPARNRWLAMQGGGR